MQRAIVLLQDWKWLSILGIALSVGCVILSAKFGIEVNLVILTLLFAGASYYVIDRQPVYGMFVLLASTFVLPLVIKIFHVYEAPVTTFIELIDVIFFGSLVLKRKIRGGTTFIGILILIWFVVQFAETLNPASSSRIAGIFAFRSMIMLVLAFFASYSAIRNKADVYTFIYGWIALAFVAALYGFYQEFVGLPSFDYEWATITEFRYKLLFTYGRLRKFSFFTSPGEFGQVMVYGGLTCFIMAFMNRIKFSMRVFMFIASIIMLTAMMFTGSRTAMVLTTAGIIIFAIITLKRSVLIGVAIVAMLGGVLIFKSYNSKTLRVMSTAFQGREDNSMNVRILNQKIIREYIKGAPVGFGLGSIGYYGSKYSGHTFIGAFPPDSEYVKIAVETGWIGLFVWLGIQFLICVWGINAYFSLADKELKDLLLIPLVMFLVMIIGQYPQEFFRAPVLAILFAALVALIAKIKTLDNATPSPFGDSSDSL